MYYIRPSLYHIVGHFMSANKMLFCHLKLEIALAIPASNDEKL